MARTTAPCSRWNRKLSAMASSPSSTRQRPTDPPNRSAHVVYPFGHRIHPAVRRADQRHAAVRSKTCRPSARDQAAILRRVRKRLPATLDFRHQIGEVLLAIRERHDGG
jgi:hypothetical protein